MQPAIHALETVAARCRTAGGEATAVQTDVTDIEAVYALAHRAVTVLGVVDVWVSNVGVGAIRGYQETPMHAPSR